MLPFHLTQCPFPVEFGDGAITGITSFSPIDGHYLIIIDSNLPEDQKQNAIKHEISHVYFDHFHTDVGRSSDEVEAEADRFADQMTDEELSNLMKYRIRGRYVTNVDL